MSESDLVLQRQVGPFFSKVFSRYTHIVGVRTYYTHSRIYIQLGIRAPRPYLLLNERLSTPYTFQILLTLLHPSRRVCVYMRRGQYPPSSNERFSVVYYINPYHLHNRICMIFRLRELRRPKRLVFQLVNTEAMLIVTERKVGKILLEF